MSENVTYTAELMYLSAIREARADFFDSVVETADLERASTGDGELKREERKLLRSEGVAQLAEFFFVIEESGLNSDRKISAFLERHNDDMKALLASCEKGYTRFGLSAARIKQSLFSQPQIDLIIHESARGSVTFDQRSIGKVLTQVMSFETCRTLLVLLASCKLIQRHDFKSVVLISSNGLIEELYRNHLRSIVKETSRFLRKDG